MKIMPLEIKGDFNKNEKFGMLIMATSLIAIGFAYTSITIKDKAVATSGKPRIYKIKNLKLTNIDHLNAILWTILNGPISLLLGIFILFIFFVNLF